jgi:hypothetical protein
VIASGAFDGDEAIEYIMGSKRGTNLDDGRVEVEAIVGDDSGRDEDVAVEVGEEKLGAAFVAIAADDGEVFGSDLLDAGVQDAAWLAEGSRGGTTGRTFAGTGRSHETSLQKRERAHPILAAGARKRFF